MHARDCMKAMCTIDRPCLRGSLARRAALDEAGVKGAYLDSDEGNDGQQSGGNGSRKYFRVLKSIDISSEHSKTVQNIVEQVFNSLATRVVVESKPAEGGDLESYILELKDSLWLLVLS